MARRFSGTLADGESENIALGMLIDEIGFQISSDEPGTLTVSYLEEGASGFIVLTTIQDSGIIVDLMGIQSVRLICSGGNANWILVTRNNIVSTPDSKWSTFQETTVES